MTAIAFIAGGVGLLAWALDRYERDVRSWYPTGPASLVPTLLAIAAAAAALAAVAWVYVNLT